jgi:hypothetical protein
VKGKSAGIRKLHSINERTNEHEFSLHKYVQKTDSETTSVSNFGNERRNSGTKTKFRLLWEITAVLNAEIGILTNVESGIIRLVLISS